MPFKKLTSLTLFTLLSFFGTALVISLISPPVYGQTADAWNIHRQGLENDLNFYYGLSSLPNNIALQLNTNGNAQIHRLIDIDNISRILDPSSISTLQTLQLRPGGNTAGLNILSSNAGQSTWLEIGRTIADGKLAVTGSAGQFALNAASGDIVLSAETGKLYLNAGTNDQDIVVSGNNVGIGMSNPGRLLNLRAAASTPALKLSQASSDNGWSMYADNTTGDFSLGYDQGTYTEKFHISIAGNVGIATSSAPGKLTIQAPAQETSPAIRLLQASQSLYGWDIGVDSDHFGEMNIYALNNTAQVLLMSFDRSNYRVGIGTNTPSQKLDVSGNIYASGSITSQGSLWVMSIPSIPSPGSICRSGSTGQIGDCSSDRRLKENINALNISGLDLITKLKPSTFDFITDGKNQTGFIAQDVLEVLPEAVTKSTDGYYGLNDMTFTPYLVKAIQELSQENKQLSGKLEKQQKQIDELKKQIQEIKSAR